jgi:hypothetical protein
MPGIFRAIGDELKSRVSQTGAASVNAYEDFTSEGA